MLRVSEKATSRVKELLAKLNQKADVKVSNHLQPWMHYVGLLHARAKLAEAAGKDASELRVVADELEEIGQPVRVGQARVGERMVLALFVLEDGGVVSALTTSALDDPSATEEGE